MDKLEVERSIIKKFRKEIYRPFVKAIMEFNLIEENDVVAVCISGGKDSFLLSKCIEEIQKHGKIRFTVKYIMLDPGYNKDEVQRIKNNARSLGINLNIIEYNIFDSIKNEQSPCYLCARKRRGALYNYAQSLGCNKIALGHNFDDVIETILMSLIYNGEFKTMMPVLDSTNFNNMKLIRPLYFIKESDIISWCFYNKLEFESASCQVTSKKLGKRNEMKELISKLNDVYKDAAKNIMRSTYDVNLNTIISYKKGENDDNQL